MDQHDLVFKGIANAIGGWLVKKDDISLLI
jgi:hypothetical protein